MSEEIWRPVVGFEGLYEISSLGRARSLFYARKQKPPPRYLRPSVRPDGYLAVTLMTTPCSPRHPKTIHRMVAEAFLPQCEGRNFVNHLDFNRQNNRVENLEWVTNSENLAYSVEHGRNTRGEQVPQSKLNRFQVIAIRRICNSLPHQMIARRFGISVTTVSEIVNRKTWRWLTEETVSQI